MALHATAFREMRFQRIGSTQGTCTLGLREEHTGEYCERILWTDMLAEKKTLRNEKTSKAPLCMRAWGRKRSRSVLGQTKPIQIPLPVPIPESIVSNSCNLADVPGVVRTCC